MRPPFIAGPAEPVRTYVRLLRVREALDRGAAFDPVIVQLDQELSVLEKELDDDERAMLALRQVPQVRRVPSRRPRASLRR